jgi:hypothetical protein
VLSGKQREKQAAELTQTARNVELETLVKSQADKIAEFEKMCASMWWEKEDVTAGYRRLGKLYDDCGENRSRESTTCRNPGGARETLR